MYLRHLAAGLLLTAACLTVGCAHDPCRPGLFRGGAQLQQPPPAFVPQPLPTDPVPVPAITGFGAVPATAGFAPVPDGCCR